MADLTIKGREDIFEAIEEATEIDCEPWRWGTTHTHVLARDGKHYQFRVQMHSQEGLQTDSIDLVEVKPVTKTVTEWVPA